MSEISTVSVNILHAACIDATKHVLMDEVARKEMHFFEILFVAVTVRLMTFPRTRHGWKYQHVQNFRD